MHGCVVHAIIGTMTLSDSSHRIASDFPLLVIPWLLLFTAIFQDSNSETECQDSTDCHFAPPEDGYILTKGKLQKVIGVICSAEQY